MLVSASCSYAVKRPDFRKFLGQAALAAGRDATLFDYTSAGPDHPGALLLPESTYLKCAFLGL